MGNGQSVPNNINRQNEIIQEIHAVATDLAETYSTKFLDPKFCTGIALIYNNKLMNFRKQALNNVSMTLGLVADIPEQKQQLCNSIVQHYTDRINLIAAIQQSLNYCSNRIFALTSGPRCEGSPEVFEQDACAKAGGRWVGYVVPPDDKIKENAQWYGYVNQMQGRYIEILARMLDILKQLKDFDEDINDERLKVMGLEVEQLIDIMQKTCYQLYKLALTTPTFTEAEIIAQQEVKQMNAQESAARLAALRTTHGLSAIAEK